MKRELLIMMGVCIAAGCSSSAGNTDAASTADARADGTVARKDLYPDLGALPDLGKPEPCASQWDDAVLPQKTVSAGPVVTKDLGGGIKETQIDATAGGTTAAAKNPYVYVSLVDGKQVLIDDYAAKKSVAWDIALKRATIRINGGDSGAGQGAVAILPAKKLADVTAPPAANVFLADDFLDDKCQIIRDPINNIRTAIGGQSGVWYDYDVAGGKLTPKAETYVIRTAAGKFVKLVIDSYYDANSVGARYTVRWAAL